MASCTHCGAAFDPAVAGTCPACKRRFTIAPDFPEPKSAHSAPDFPQQKLTAPSLTEARLFEDFPEEKLPPPAPPPAAVASPPPQPAPAAVLPPLEPSAGPLASTFRAPAKPPQVVEDTVTQRERVRARGWKPVAGGVIGEEEPVAEPEPVAPPSRRAPLLAMLAVGGVLASAAVLFVAKPWEGGQPAATPAPPFTPFGFVPTPTLFPKVPPVTSATPAATQSLAEPTATPAP